MERVSLSYPLRLCIMTIFRYLFPPAPCDGLIDLTEDDKPFYFNPFSGELSLEFPKAERKLKGGILA